MRKTHLLAIIAGLLLALLVPASQADATTKDDRYYQTDPQCPAGFELSGDVCERTTTETFPADETVTVSCPDGFEGPDDTAGECIKRTKETFPASPVVELLCPDGFDGPDGNGLCVRDTVTDEVVHVIESTVLVCAADATLVGDACVRDALVLVQEAPITRTELECSPELSGPNANGECSEIVVNTAPGAVGDGFTCPQGFDLVGLDCTRDEVVNVSVGVVLFAEDTCPAGYQLINGNCVRSYPTIIEQTCPEGFALFQTNSFGLSCLPSPPTSVPAVAPVPTPVCPEGAEGPIVDGRSTFCEERVPPIPVNSVNCPDGVTQPVQNLCTSEVTETLTIPAVPTSSFICPDGFAGPDANNRCIQVAVETAPATPVDVTECGEGFVGPTVDGVCISVATEQVSVPAIGVPTFECPAGFAGPDDKWNCSRSSGGTETVAVEEVVVGLTCPSDAKGPDANDQCYRVSVEIEPAITTIDYSCPSGAAGPNADNQCEISSVEQVDPVQPCVIEFYDYPNLHGFLYASGQEGIYEFTGALAWLDNDVESVYIHHGCTFSLARHVGGVGWCVTLGEGRHNITPDQLSWVSNPGTGCDSSGY